MKLKLCYNHVFMEFSAGLQVTFKNLDQIYEETRPNQMASMKSQKCGSHASDNYQQWHPFYMQRDSTAGLIHNGIVLT